MKNTLIPVLVFFALTRAYGQPDYQSLDTTDPIVFGGSFIIYRADTFKLGAKHFFIDGHLPDEEVAKYPFVFNTVQSAVAQLTNGTEEEPMTLYIAPYVYWVDDPDDPEVRMPAPGDPVPYGLKIACEWLRFYGLTQQPENVVLASNRGQTIGAKGNFTMFRIHGDGTSAENITFGNYCNIDLEYPLLPRLSRKKRASAIVQAQLIHCDGDKIVARNAHFLSRLNLCPFVGAKRILFDHCHLESTDDALTGTGVYLNSTLEFHSSKPFYHTTGTGAVFLNCDITSFSGARQYFTKANGQLAVVDTRITGAEGLYLGWNDLPPEETRNYQYNVQLNGKQSFIGAEDSSRTVQMSGREVLGAYRLVDEGGIIYNTYNLLRGDDDWDPMGIKGRVAELENNSGENYSSMPIQMKLSTTRDTLETERDTLEVTAHTYRFGNFEVEADGIEWRLAKGSELLAALRLRGNACTIIPTNITNEAGTITLIATTPSGLEAASVFTIKPKTLEAPNFRKNPTFEKAKGGSISITYGLDTPFEDQTNITWYRCADKNGGNPVEVAVSRVGPLASYSLRHGDVGYYLKAVLEPKHIRSEAGKAMEVITKKPIAKREASGPIKWLHPDFSILSTQNQPEAIPGFFTFKHIPNPDRPAKGDAWRYGTGKDGGAGRWGLLQGRSGLMGYTPTEKQHGDMSISLKVAPFKTAGQGFSVAPLYMDVLIHFDLKTMTGYGLRIMRTTKYGNAVDFLFVKYENGGVVPISEAVSASCYRTLCTIVLGYKEGRLTATASTDAQYDTLRYSEEIVHQVEMSTAAPQPSSFGLGIFYHGGASAVIEDMEVIWD